MDGWDWLGLGTRLGEPGEQTHGWLGLVVEDKPSELCTRQWIDKSELRSGSVMVVQSIILYVCITLATCLTMVEMIG